MTAVFSQKPNVGASDVQRNQRMLVMIMVVVAVMVGLAFASVPLYRLFCQVTGFGGTTQIASSVPVSPAIDLPDVSVRFDANVNPQLKWHFEAVTRPVSIKPGEQVTALYRATNISDRPSTGTATFNVTPQKAGPFFMKIECFCFTEQTLQPGQSMDMPVTFFVDSDMANDENTQDIDEIVLSYTFFEARG